MQPIANVSFWNDGFSPSKTYGAIYPKVPTGVPTCYENYPQIFIEEQNSNLQIQNLLFLSFKALA